MLIQLCIPSSGMALPPPWQVRNGALRDRALSACRAAQWDKVKAIQRPLPDGALQILGNGEKQDGTAELVNLAERASQPQAPVEAIRW